MFDFKIRPKLLKAVLESFSIQRRRCGNVITRTLLLFHLGSAFVWPLTVQYTFIWGGKTQESISCYKKASGFDASSLPY